MTLAIPFGGRDPLKVGYSNHMVTNSGTDYDQFLVCYLVSF